MNNSIFETDGSTAAAVNTIFLANIDGCPAVIYTLNGTYIDTRAAAVAFVADHIFRCDICCPEYMSGRRCRCTGSCIFGIILHIRFCDRKHMTAEGPSAFRAKYTGVCGADLLFLHIVFKHVYQKIGLNQNSMIQI